MSSSKTQIINLLILAVAIILVAIARSKFSELFVANVPLPPHQSGAVNIQGDHPMGNPYQYPNQIYPAKIPYYPELGRPCESQGSCGVLGKCENGVCTSLPYNKTVFNQSI